MEYIVNVKKKTGKGLRSLPLSVKQAFYLLIRDLQNEGPYQKGWPHYSPLGDDRYHCHLTLSYVACWKWYKGTIEIEVYYVGSRESAPY